MPPTTEVEKAHDMTIAQGSDSDSDSKSDAGPSSVLIASSTLSDIPPSNSPDTPIHSRSYRSTSPQPSTSTGINIDARHITVRRPRKERQAESSDFELDTSQKKLAHPNTFQTLRKKKIKNPRKPSFAHIYSIMSYACRKRDRQIYRLWMTIQDIIGQASLRPVLIRRLFWTPNLIHWHRILICTFVYVNGLNPEIFFEWVILLQLGRDSAAYRHFCALFRLFENGRNYTL